jgi:hypothetical protein
MRGSEFLQCKLIIQPRSGHDLAFDDYFAALNSVLTDEKWIAHFSVARPSWNAAGHFWP